jgi:hypothetical protein
MFPAVENKIKKHYKLLYMYCIYYMYNLQIPLSAVAFSRDLLLTLKVLSSEIDPAEIRLIR